MPEKKSAKPVAIILTALATDYRAVCLHIEQITEEVYKGTIYQRGLFRAGSLEWIVGITQVSQHSNEVARETERMIEYFHPTVAFFIGTAGGIKDVRLGDVVVAEKIYGYESAKSWRSLLLARPEVERPEHPLLERAKAEARQSEKGWLLRVTTSTWDMPIAPKVLLKPIASGEKLVTSTLAPLLRWLHRHYEDAVAIEMEGRGFLTAVHANTSVQALVVRGIANLLDNKQETDAAKWQMIAAQHASAFAFEVLAKFNPQPHDVSTAVETSQIIAHARIIEEKGYSLIDIMINNKTATNGVFTELRVNFVDGHAFHPCPSSSEAGGTRSYLPVTYQYAMTLSTKFMGQARPVVISQLVAAGETDHFQIRLKQDEIEDKYLTSIWYYLEITLILDDKRCIPLEALLCSSIPIDQKTMRSIWPVEDTEYARRNRETALRLAALPGEKSETVAYIIGSLQKQHS